MKAILRQDTLIVHTRELNRGRHPAAGYSHEEWRYKESLRKLLGVELTLVQLLRGIEDYYYALADLNYVGRVLESHVIAIHQRHFEAYQDIDSPLAPLSREHMQFKIFAKDGLGTVKVLTPWTDGFCAFRPLTEEEKKGI